MPSRITRVIDDAMKQLPEELHRAITLRESEGLGYEAVAAVMRCPVETARARIFEAREAIAEKLRPVLQTPESRMRDAEYPISPASSRKSRTCRRSGTPTRFACASAATPPGSSASFSSASRR